MFHRAIATRFERGMRGATHFSSPVACSYSVARSPVVVAVAADSFEALVCRLRHCALSAAAGPACAGNKLKLSATCLHGVLNCKAGPARSLG